MVNVTEEMSSIKEIRRKLVSGRNKDIVAYVDNAQKTIVAACAEVTKAEHALSAMYKKFDDYHKTLHARLMAVDSMREEIRRRNIMEDAVLGGTTEGIATVADDINNEDVVNDDRFAKIVADAKTTAKKDPLHALQVYQKIAERIAGSIASVKSKIGKLERTCGRTEGEYKVMQTKSTALKMTLEVMQKRFLRVREMYMSARMSIKNRAAAVEAKWPKIEEEI